MTESGQEQSEGISLPIDWHFPEAIQAFKRIFSGYLDVLSEEEGNLSEYMHEQLQYLRSTTRIV
jgi:hypothetical protein